MLSRPFGNFEGSTSGISSISYLSIPKKLNLKLDQFLNLNLKNVRMLIGLPYRLMLLNIEMACTASTGCSNSTVPKPILKKYFIINKSLKNVCFQRKSSYLYLYLVDRCKDELLKLFQLNERFLPISFHQLYNLDLRQIFCYLKDLILNEKKKCIKNFRFNNYFYFLIPVILRESRN